jgi:hypothetical protein
MDGLAALGAIEHELSEFPFEVGLHLEELEAQHFRVDRDLGEPSSPDPFCVWHKVSRSDRVVADTQQWGTGEVPSRPLATIIDSLHFVRSHASPGVQIADLAAYVIERRRPTPTEPHPDADAAMARMGSLVWDHTRTWRQTWP